MTLKEIAQEIEEDENAARRAAVEALEKLWQAREARKAYEAFEKSARTSIDAFFQMNPEESEVRDDELGYRAYYRSGGESEVYDTVAAIKGRNKDLYKRLKELGAVSEALDTSVVKDAIAKGLLMPMDVEPFRHRKERTPSLMVERTKE